MLMIEPDFLAFSSKVAVDARQRTANGFVRAPSVGMGHHSPAGHIRRRSYYDAAGVFWTVEFRDRVDSISRHIEPMLLFTSASGFRCVRDFPEDWYLLDDRALEGLSWKT